MGALKADRELGCSIVNVEIKKLLKFPDACLIFTGETLATQEAHNLLSQVKVTNRLW